MCIFLSLRKRTLSVVWFGGGGCCFSPLIVEILFIEHEYDRVKEQKCQVLFLVALGKIVDFSTTIICSFFCINLKQVLEEKTALDVQHLLETSSFNLLQIFIIHLFSFLYLI